MSKRLKITPNNLVGLFLIVLCLLQISFQSLDPVNQPADSFNSDHFTLDNGLKCLTITYPKSQAIHISIAIKKQQSSTSISDKCLSFILQALIKYKLNPANNYGKYQEFLAKPNIYDITDSGHFIIIGFSLNDPQCPIPFEILQRVIVPRPSLDVIKQVKNQVDLNLLPITPADYPAEANIAKKWTEMFSFPNIRLAIATPSQPLAIVDLLKTQFSCPKQPNQAPIMYSPDDITPEFLNNRPRLLIQPKIPNSLTPTEKTTFTVFVPLLNDIRNQTVHPLSSLHCLFHLSYKIYTKHFETRPDKIICIKNISLATLGTRLGLHVIIEEDCTGQIEITEALDLVEGLCLAIKMAYKDPDSNLYQVYQQETSLAPSPIPNMPSFFLANLASVHMFFVEPSDIINFVFTPTSQPQEIHNLDDMLKKAIQRENWYINGDLTYTHWQQLAGQPLARPLIIPIPQATRASKQIKNIILRSSLEARPKRVRATLSKKQPRTSNFNTSVQSQGDTPGPQQNQRPRPVLETMPFIMPTPSTNPQQAEPGTYPDNLLNLNSTGLPPILTSIGKHNVPGLEAHIFKSSQYTTQAAIAVVLITNDYLANIKTYIWHVAHVLTVLDMVKAHYWQTIMLNKLFIDAEANDRGRITITIRTSDTAIKDVLQLFLSYYKNASINPTQEVTAMLKAYNFFANAAIQTPPTLQQCLFARIWRLHLYTPNECCKAILEKKASFNSPIVTTAQVNIRVEDASLDTFHQIINTVTSYITPQAITKYQAIRNYDTEIYMSLEPELMSAFVGYFHIDPANTLDRTNYHILAYYLLLAQFPPKSLADHPNPEEIEYWINTQAPTPPSSTSAASPPRFFNLSFDVDILRNLEYSITILDETIALNLILKGQYTAAAFLNSYINYKSYLTWAIDQITPKQFEEYKNLALVRFMHITNSKSPSAKRSWLLSCSDFWQEPHYQRKFIETLNQITLADFQSFFTDHCQHPHIVIYQGVPDQLSQEPPQLPPLHSQLPMQYQQQLLLLQQQQLLQQMELQPHQLQQLAQQLQQQQQQLLQQMALQPHQLQQLAQQLQQQQQQLLQQISSNPQLQQLQQQLLQQQLLSQQISSNPQLQQLQQQLLQQQLLSQPQPPQNQPTTSNQSLPPQPKPRPTSKRKQHRPRFIPQEEQSTTPDELDFSPPNKQPKQSNPSLQ
ncbi:hypothetical protein NEHOM01_0073 [Nematocida homosporus]|uniref:uncharacterized protein n=1 Tax=Nematocida homosporus TaxID=1912981 RepID=UPI0022205DF5|nr:uncharacterized protein NEHOM01_0073 [Nematocida homosporus]KAI5184328.1 hypothetical protein NEHOM01_0073 [Nematocida homosporus]